MSFGANNSRNIANLLRNQPLQPIQPRRNINNSQPQPIISNNQRPREQIPIEDVFTPQDNLQRRNYKRRTPMSSGNGVDGSLRVSNREQDVQIQGLKVRLDQVIKFYDERHNKLQTKFSIRLNELQNFVMKEVPKVDNANMMSADLVSCKQGIKQLRRQTDQQSQQLATLKIITQQRAAKDSLAIDPKEKQKMTVLFMQMVRLGDSVQKMQSGMNSANRSYEVKIQQLEYKLANSQKNIALMSQRRANGDQVLSEFGDKVMDRLQTAQNNLAVLGKERIKDKQTINQLIAQNERIGEDVQSLVKNIQGQFSNKLQNRISQTVSRLMYEHEQRINAQQQIKKNLDIRQRINLQKQNNDKQQLKNRYQNMDALVRTQFIKKQQSIRGLHNLMEQQMRNVQKQFLNQGSKRKQTQNLLRGQIKRVQQSFRRQYDIYKAHQSDLVQKIGGVVKEQIQVRLNSQLNLKKLTSDIANQLVNDLNGVKQALSNTTKKLNLSIKQIANQSSQRAGQLSHYVDQQVKKVVDVVTEKYSKMKSVFTKLAQQLRNHLLNTQTNRKNVQARLVVIEQDFDKMKGQVTQQIQQFYTDLEQRLKQQKQYVQTEVFKKNNDLSIRVNKLQQYTSQYFELLKTNIQDNKQILNKKVNNINEQKNPQSQQDIKELRGIVFNIRGITQELKVESRQSFEDIRKQIKQKNTQLRRQTIERQRQTDQKIAKNTQSIKQLDDNLNQITVKVNALRTQANSQSPISNDRIKKLSDQIDQLNAKIKKSQRKGDDDHRDNQQQIIKLRSAINVLKGQVGALDDDIKKLSS